MNIAVHFLLQACWSADLYFDTKDYSGMGTPCPLESEYAPISAPATPKTSMTGETDSCESHHIACHSEPSQTQWKFDLRTAVRLQFQCALHHLPVEDMAVWTLNWSTNKMRLSLRKGVRRSFMLLAFGFHEGWDRKAKGRRQHPAASYIWA